MTVSTDAFDRLCKSNVDQDEGRGFFAEASGGRGGGEAEGVLPAKPLFVLV